MKEKSIKIGAVSIPLDSYVIGGTALLGIRESGKTVAAKGIAEQLLEHGVPIVVFDAIGVWRYLKTAGDGANAKGYQVVVAGGKEPDLTLNPNTAEQIVRAAIKENIPLVIDLYDQHLSKADWRRIVQKCFRVLLYENEGLRHVFLEETAEYAPQKVLDGETYAEVEKFVRMGGNRSLGITLINQRAQEVNKAILDLCENVVLFRQRGAKAIENLQKWTERLDPITSKRIASDMPNMKAGECWVFTSESDAPIFTKTTLPNSFHPDRRKPEAVAGRKIADTKQFVQRMESDLLQLIEEKKANDPKELKKQIAELQKQLAAKMPTAVPDQEAIEKATTPLVRRIDQLELVISESKGMAESLGSVAMDFQDNLLSLTQSCQGLATILRIENMAICDTIPNKHKSVEVIGKPAAAASGSKRVPMTEAGASFNGELGKGERAILTVLAQYPHGKNRRALGTLSGYSSSGGSFGTYLSRLRTKGLIHGSDPILITQEGVNALGDFEPLPRGEDLQNWWMAKLGKGERELLKALIKNFPDEMTRAELGERAGYEPTGGSFGTYLSRLRTKELIHPTRLIASEAFFE